MEQCQLIGQCVNLATASAAVVELMGRLCVRGGWGEESCRSLRSQGRDGTPDIPRFLYDYYCGKGLCWS